MMNSQTATKDQVLDYLKTRGRKDGSRTLKILGENAQFMQAFNTEVGFQLLKHICKSHEDMFNKIASLEATDAEKQRFKILEEEIYHWAEILNRHEEEVTKIQK
jgi:flavorubredoxin